MSVLPDWMIERDVKIEPFAENQKREGKISYGNGSYGYDARIGYIFKIFSPINATVIDPKNFDPKALVDIDLTPDEHDWTVESSGVSSVHQCKKCGLWTHHPEDKTNCSKKPDHILIPPHSFVLGETIETFKIPRDVLCIVLGKSTYARCGVIVNVTPGEPEWVGKWTVEISNTTPLPVKIYAGEGIMQCIFLRTDGIGEQVFDLLKSHYPASLDKLKGMCKVSYADKKGKYQSQTGLTIPKVDGTK